MPRRSRLEIYIDVLRSIKNGKHLLTPIMYNANLSYAPLREILDFLIEKELIKTKKKKRSTFYQITPKGLEVLTYFTKGEQILSMGTYRCGVHVWP